MHKAIIISIGTFLGFHAMAETRVTEPTQACSLLNEVGLQGRKWSNYYGQEFGCSSPYKDIGAAFPLPNNIAYYVKGSSEKASNFKIVLNVNDPSNASSAHKELQIASGILAKKVAQVNQNQPILNAIAEGRNFSQKTGNSTITVIKEVWPTGKGYEIRVSIE